MDPFSIIADVSAATAGASAALALSVFTFIIYQRNPRFPTAAHIPPHRMVSSVISKSAASAAAVRRQRIPRPLYGRVSAVTDGDNFRFYHRPWPWRLFHRRVPTKRQDLKDQTIVVRISGVDAPESAHFGMPAQPFSADARAELTRLVEGKDVVLVPHARDRYSRLVATAYVRRFGVFKRNVSLEMARKGMASVYSAAGAEYGGIKTELDAAERHAREKKLGIWSLPKAKYISPGDHKKEHLRGGGP